MTLFQSPEERRLEDDIWLAARGGKRPRPYGVYLWVCMIACPYIGMRTLAGLPKTLAPIFESPIVMVPVKIVLFVSGFVFIGCVFCYMFLGFRIRTPYWEIRVGKNKSRRIVAPLAAILAVIAVEAFFGVFYLLEWLIASIA